MKKILLILKIQTLTSMLISWILKTNKIIGVYYDSRGFESSYDIQSYGSDW